MLILILLLSSIYTLYSLKLFPLDDITFLKKNNIKKELSNMISTDNYEPVILDGEKTILKKDYCKLLCEMNNFNFKEYSFDQFINYKPYYRYERTLLFVNDFLVDNGRILKYNEENELLQIPETNNLIILQSDNIDTIPLKDSKLLKNFRILSFPKITKKDIIEYIYKVIDYNNYSDDLYIINWNNYKNIENLDFEKLNILLFDIDIMIKNKNDKKIIFEKIDYIINSLAII